MNGQGAIALCTKNFNDEKNFVILFFLFGFVVSFRFKIVNYLP